jgi:hypothetical protein
MMVSAARGRIRTLGRERAAVHSLALSPADEERCDRRRARTTAARHTRPLPGSPLASRSVFEGFAMPDKITIFQGPHERLARTQAQLEQMVADTVWHEIAHHFGMDEAQVRKAERRRGV